MKFTNKFEFKWRFKSEKKRERKIKYKKKRKEKWENGYWAGFLHLQPIPSFLFSPHSPHISPLSMAAMWGQHVRPRRRAALPFLGRCRVGRQLAPSLGFTYLWDLMTRSVFLGPLPVAGRSAMPRSPAIGPHLDPLCAA
jgi:hypothetical protein